MPRRKQTELVTDSKPSKVRKVRALKPVEPDEVESLSDGFVPENLGVTMPNPHEFLSAMQRDGRPFGADKIYRDTWSWLNEMGCSDIVPAQLLERYAVSTARWMQCEEEISRLGFLSKHPTSGKPVSSPFVDIGISYMNQSAKLWDEINRIIKSRDTVSEEKPRTDILGQLL